MIKEKLDEFINELVFKDESNERKEIEFTVDASFDVKIVYESGLIIIIGYLQIEDESLLSEAIKFHYFMCRDYITMISWDKKINKLYLYAKMQKPRYVDNVNSKLNEVLYNQELLSMFINKEKTNKDVKLHKRIDPTASGMFIINGAI
jgi:hypothetical protein